jgi:hypothetical protein
LPTIRDVAEPAGFGAVSASDEREATPAECNPALLDLAWAPAGLADLPADGEPAVAPGEFGDAPDGSASA